MKPKLLKRIISSLDKSLNQQQLYIKKVKDHKSVLELSLLNVQDELTKEKALVEFNIELRHCYELYYKKNKERQKSILVQIQKQELLIKQAQEVLVEMKKDQMKFETLLKQSNEKLALKERISETKQLDEFSISNFKNSSLN